MFKDNNEDSNIHPIRDPEDKLHTYGKGLLVDEDKILKEAINRCHLNLTQKELAICTSINDLMWCMGFPSNEEMIDYVLKAYNKLFTDRKDIEETIEQMIKKRAIRFIQTDIEHHYNKSVFYDNRLLRFHEDIEKQSQMIMNQIFDSHSAHE